MNEIITSQGFKIAALIVAFVLIALVSFAGGTKIGFHKALFSCQWGENYERNFIGRGQYFGKKGFTDFMARGFEGKNFRNSHGLSGTIISITDSQLIIKDKEDKENVVLVTDKTAIKKTRFDNLKLNDLKVDDRIVVMGKPDENGVIRAILIRVFEF